MVINKCTNYQTYRIDAIKKTCYQKQMNEIGTDNRHKRTPTEQVSKDGRKLVEVDVFCHEKNDVNVFYFYLKYVMERVSSL